MGTTAQGFWIEYKFIFPVAQRHYIKKAPNKEPENKTYEKH